MILYFGSRAIAAAGNLFSVALFARMVGPSEYGAYILMFAWAIVVYGFAAQWMKFAYFGVFRVANEGAIIASYARLLAVSLVAVTAVMALLSFVVPLDPWFAAALVALFASMTVYEAAVEVNRTRLQVRTVAVSMVARAVLVLLFGCATLAVYPSAVMLAFAVSVGHLVAAIPSLYMLRDCRSAEATRDAAINLIRYGWPLIFSFGVFAIGQTIDRFLISHEVGNAALGPYGVVADMMRQSYMVVGESIALALITVAKRHADEGRRDESDSVMRSAFSACVLAAGFGAVFFMLFGARLVELLLGADFATPVAGIIPIFAVAFGFMMLRSFYFAQVIYFTDGSFLELVIAVVFVAISALLAIMLVPSHGAVGGAVALMVAQGAACIVSAVFGRRLHVLPVDYKVLVGIPAVSGALLLACWLLADIIASRGWLILAQGALFTGALVLTAWRLDLIKLVAPRKMRARVAP